ncbi:hypothetical protein QBC41DRAFT_276733 [Cercophora samala]|uniref:Ubiquitin-like domain-containing protein n=1 Tax=Cercophora samala TaxID=330535 RepID=A0AA39ZDL0_9PEZI|nr:hypothetical protein QBC41DRAFT_276733 [Cercophora samala]
MEFALTFGAVGDFLALLSLINDIRSALDDCRGSNKTYRDLVESLTLLQKSLEQVEKIYQGPNFASGLQDLGAIAQATVNQACASLQEFRDKVSSKYGSSLASNGSGNVFKDVTRKIQWKFEEKDVEQFRAKVAGLTVSLNLLLDVTAVRLIQQGQEATAKRIDDAEKNTTSKVQQFGHSVEKSFKFFGSRIMSKLDFLSTIGIDLTSSASQIVTLMFTMSRDLASMGVVLLRLERGVNNGEHFVLEDATGRTLPIHLKTITSWEALEFILNDRFKGRKGERRIRRKLYSLHESASHQKIDRSALFEDAFVPYQKVDMSIVCRAPEVPQADGAADTGLSSCPWCHTVSPGKLGARVQCSNCKKNFTREVIELDDDLEAPMAPATDRAMKLSEKYGPNGDECSECHQPKTPSGQEQKRKRPIDLESDSDEENVTGLAHIILQTKKMRIIKSESKLKEPEIESFQESEPIDPVGAGTQHYTSDEAYPVPREDRAHFDGSFSTYAREYSPLSKFASRYTSNGQYATANEPIHGRDPRWPDAYQPTVHPMITHSSSYYHVKTPVRKPAEQQKSKDKSRVPTPRAATVADAEEHRIPAGYNLKQWDPTEEPILLLGSVFDANSIGKWIYDWTVYENGPSTPISDMAGEMWLLLIKLAGKIKRCDEIIPRIQDADEREMAEEFVEAGDRLTDKFRKVLKACEKPMLKTKSDGKLGNEAGVEFVRCMFGREGELEKTERWMASVTLWNLRFDANCEDVLRKPLKPKVLAGLGGSVGVEVKG